MPNLFNPDFQEFLRAMNRFEVRYVLVGGYSVVFHGYPRTTGVMNLLVEVSQANYDRLVRSFSEFGLPLYDLTLQNFLFNESIEEFSYGRPPIQIEILKKISGIDFESVFQEAVISEIDGITLRIINLQHLLINKKASGWHKDLDELENLEAIQ